jgi:quercetin dioxygenase-like cupin family protein
LSVFYEGIGVKKFPQGSTYVETMNVNHFGENTTDSVVKVLVVYAGAEGSETVLPARE